MLTRLTIAIVVSCIATKIWAEDSLSKDMKIKEVAYERLSRTINEITQEKKEELVKNIDNQIKALSVEAQKIQKNLVNAPIATQSAIQDKLNQALQAKEAVSITKDVVEGTQPVPDDINQLKYVTEVIRWYTRPIWVVCDGKPWFPTKPLALNKDKGAPPDYTPVVQPKIDVLSKSAQATGLISVSGKGQLATGVVVGEKYVLTNKHVLTEGGLAFYNEATNSWSLYDGKSVRIEFPFEYNKCPSVSPIKKVLVKGVFYVDKDLDFAILETEIGLPNKITFADSDDADGGDRVIVIGYPDRPKDEAIAYLSPAQIDQIFSAPNGRTPIPAERMSAGMVIREEVPEGYFSHDASTWAGNSGSVVVNLATGNIIGLHAAGLESFKEGRAYNLAVSSTRIARILKEKNL